MNELKLLPPVRTYEPEEKLYLAVLNQAIKDYLRFRKQKDYDWFFSDDCKQICLWIDVEQSYLIKLIRLVSGAKQKHK